MKPLLIVLLLAGVLASPTRGEEAAVLELEMNWLPPVPVLSAVPGRWSYRTTSLAAHSTNSLPRDVLTAYSGETILFSSRGSYDPDGGPIVQRAWYVEHAWAPNTNWFCRASDNYCLQSLSEEAFSITLTLPAGVDSARVGMFLYVEDDEGQTREKHFVVEVRREGRRLYYARDMLGSVREVVDSHGRVVEVRDYDPWGLELPGRSRVEGVKTREGYTGHELDEETGLNYAGARFYDPAIGRWFVPDPLAAKYPGYSPYNYVLNDPIVLTDPTGLCPDDGSAGPNQYGLGECFKQIVVEGERPHQAVVSEKKPSLIEQWAGSRNIVGQAIYGMIDGVWRGAQTLNPFTNRNERHLDGSLAFPSDRMNGFVAVATTAVAPLVPVTTANGFLFGSITVRSPFNIPVQRFGNMSLTRPDFWGARVGTNPIVNRSFVAIHPRFGNPLTQYTTGMIPKGAPIQVGIIGPQGWIYPGGLPQFIVKSKSVINQSSKIITR